MKQVRKTLVVVAATFALSACATGERFGSASKPRPATATQPPAAATAWDSYARQLAAVDPAALRQWEDASRRALRSGLSVAPTFRERVRFPASAPHAIAYRFNLREGQLLRITIEPLDDGSRLFTDMFQALGGEIFRPVEVAAARGRELHFRARSTGEFVLRLQPELGGGSYEVLVEGDGLLLFPVAGAGVHNVIGVFGDARDGGVRRHEGVDIAAPRGTPVVAVVSGRVLQARATRVGGRIVWLSDDASNLTYYYAHLDDHRVHEGARVSAGDILGTVGTTGNAEGTTPHLHFGVYRPGTVALDPAPLLDGTSTALAVDVDPAMLGRWARPTAERVRLRSSPHMAGAVITELSSSTSLLVLGGIGEWHRVILADGTTGFVAARLTAPDDSAYGGQQ
jgi:peptidoglycan LD-endopeptidase LytH